jgi:molybdopterin molybdotransferase
VSSNNAQFTKNVKPLLDLDHALEELRAFAQPLLSTQTLSTFAVDQRVLRKSIVSELNVPAHDNSAMDGYAIRAEDAAQAGALLKVTQRIPAGSVGLPLKRGEAARIFTGAPIPSGANAVVIQEECETLEDGAVVKIQSSVSQAQCIRFAGEDIAVGSTVVEQGVRLTPAMLGMAASVGYHELCVSRAPRVALFSTGDELVMPGELAPSQMRAGQIYNSNRFFLKTLLERAGCVVNDMGNIADSFELTKASLSAAAQDHDLILTSGGVSVGEEDHIKPSVQALGELHQWALSIKPGKPFAYGRISRKAVTPSEPGSHAPLTDSSYAHFIGLPGNPVSSFVTFMLLVQPFLAYLQGQTHVQYRHMPMRAAFDWPRGDKRREFLRVRQNEDGTLSLFPNQSSGVLTSVVWGDGVVDNPAGNVIKAGDWVRFIPFEGWLR